jgi:hypothetical protein
VVLVTIAGPGGHVDVGVRSDATPADLVGHLGPVLGLTSAGWAAERRSPPRPGGRPALRAGIQASVPLAEAGVADGDIVVFTEVGLPAAGERGTTAHD